MELLNVIRARSIWFFDLYDLNPRGKNIGQELIGWLGESYRFSKVPSSILDVDNTNALVFLAGRFKVGEETIGVDLRVYPDGLVGDSRSSTDDTDAFLKDALESAGKKFGLLNRLDVIRRVVHTSELNVRCKRALTGLNPKLKDISAKISSLVGVQQQSPFDVFGISFWHDPQSQSGLSQFRIEKRLNIAASENRYYSVAPLKTFDHLAILEELEELLADH